VSAGTAARAEAQAIVTGCCNSGKPILDPPIRGFIGYEIVPIADGSN